MSTSRKLRMQFSASQMNASLWLSPTTMVPNKCQEEIGVALLPEDKA